MTLRSLPGLVSLRPRPEMDVATWLELARLSLKPRHGWQWGRSRPGFLVSRPGNPTVGRNEVAT